MHLGKVLVLGGSGLVGTGVREHWGGALQVDAPAHRELDVLDNAALARYLEQSDAEAVLNLAAWAAVDAAEAQRGDTTGSVYRLNVTFPGILASLCRQVGKHLIHVSTDYVFDGANAERPYTETDEPKPLCWYAETKLLGERAALSSDARVCIARIEMPFTGRNRGPRDLARLIASRLAAGQPVQGVVDQRITPVFLDDAAEAFRKLIESGYTGIIHVAATTCTTPFAFARGIAQRLQLDASVIQEVTFERFSGTRPARRPQHSWLDVTRFEREFGTGILRDVDLELDAWAAQYSTIESAIACQSR